MPDLDAIAQLVFFVLIVIGWVIKAVVESRQAKQRRSAPPAEPVEAPEHEDRGVRPPPPPTRRTTPQRPGWTEGPERLGRLDESVRARSLDPSASHTAPGRLLHSSAAAVAHGRAARRAHRASVLSRLSGGQEIAPGADLTRAGVLWSEILGPCRAARGPHRSPTATRRRGR